MRNTLNRKYLMQAIDGSLERLGLDFVDLVYCHRPDPETPVEETVWAMSDMISAGKALYWGTSEWSAESLREAWDIADRHHLHKPVVEQPQYNLLWRDRVEEEYAPLYDSIGLGLTTWSPLSSGLLTGKYLDGVPEGSRATLPGYEWLRDLLTDADRNQKVAGLAGHRRGARLHPGPAGHRLVRQEPPRLDGDHRGEPGGAGPREPGRPRRRAPADRRRHGPHRRRRRLTPAPAASDPVRLSRPGGWPCRGQSASQLGVAVDPAGQPEGEQGGRDLDAHGHERRPRASTRAPAVMTSNQASTISRVAVAMAGSWTRASMRKAK